MLEAGSWLSSSENRGALVHDAAKVGNAVGSGAKKVWNFVRH